MKFYPTLLLKPKYCQLIFQINTWLTWAEVLSNKYLIDNMFLVGDKYLIYDVKLLSIDHSEKHLIDLNGSIVSWSFRGRHDWQYILYLWYILNWQHTLLKKLKYWATLALVIFIQIELFSSASLSLNSSSTSLHDKCSSSENTILFSGIGWFFVSSNPIELCTESPLIMWHSANV